MARGAQDQAKKTFNESQGVFGTSQGNANDLYSKLFPTFQAEATNPQGFAPGDLAAMNTANQQSVGGSTAGAVGEGDLAGARTRNSGSFAPALDEAVRSGERTASENAVGIQGENAKLKEEQRQAGIAGLSGLYGQNTSDMLSALGLGTQATNALTTAGQSGWFQNMTGLISSLGQAAQGAGSMMHGGGGGCWIAEALYGETDPRTHLLRSWLNQEFRETPLGAVVMPLYLRFGKTIALAVRLSARVRNKLRPLFDQALAAAMRDRGLDSIL